MKRFLWLSSLCIVVLVFLPGRTLAQCSGERWPVKIGTDADAGLVNLSSTTATTIAALSAIATPSPLPDNGRVQPTETRVWVLNATLVKYAQSFDSDYHMVVVDDAGHTMIIEFPHPLAWALAVPSRLESHTLARSSMPFLRRQRISKQPTCRCKLRASGSSITWKDSKASRRTESNCIR